jgi:hypothetical protein
MLPALGLASLIRARCSRFSSPAFNAASQLITEDVMKQLLRFCAGLILVLALSLPAFAGEILTPPAGPQESPGVTGQQESPGFTGDIPFPGLLAALFSLF